MLKQKREEFAMRKMISALIAIMFFLGASSLYAEPVMELEGMFWMPSLDAKAKVTENSVGTEIDFSDDLDVKDEDFSEIRLNIKISDSSKIRLGFTNMDYSGDNVITQNYIFNGQTYTAGNRVVTKLDMDYLRLGFMTNFAKNSKGNEIGTLVEFKGFSGNAQLQANSLGLNENEDFDIILPTIGMYMKVNVLPKLFMYGEVSGLPAGSLGYLLDTEVGLRLQATENIAICGGYRMLSVDAEKDDDYAEIKTDGAFVSAIISY